MKRDRGTKFLYDRILYVGTLCGNKSICDGGCLPTHSTWHCLLIKPASWIVGVSRVTVLITIFDFILMGSRGTYELALKSEIRFTGPRYQSHYRAAARLCRNIMHGDQAPRPGSEDTGREEDIQIFWFKLLNHRLGIFASCEIGIGSSKVRFVPGKPNDELRDGPYVAPHSDEFRTTCIYGRLEVPMRSKNRVNNHISTVPKRGAVFHHLYSLD